MSDNLKNNYDKLYRYCYYKVKNKQVAEDITEDTFLRYFSCNSYIERGKKLAYLYSIANNLCIDYFRKAKEDSLTEDIIAEDNVDKTITSVAVKMAIKALPPELSEVLLLRYANQLKIGEIADFLGISRFAVSRKIKAAVNQLKKILSKEDFYE